MSKQRKVLIADADLKLRQALREVFIEHGWLVVEAESVPMAMQRMLDERPDICMVDVQLSGSKGTEFARDLIEGGVDIPVIVMTDKPTRTSVAEARDLEVAAYILKPFKNIIEVVERAGRIADEHRQG